MENLRMESKVFTPWRIFWGVIIVYIINPFLLNAQEFIEPSSADSYFIGEKMPINLTPSYSHIFYGRESIKEDANTWGLYGYIDSKLDLFEFGWQILDLQFKDQTELTQNDYTFAYTNYWLPNWKFRSGIHYIDSSSEFIDAAYITFGGIHYYESDSYEIGADYFYSNYESNVPDLEVYQVNPHVGWYWAKSDEWTVRSDITGYYIFTDRDLSLGRQNFYSAEGRITAGGGSMFYSIFGWAGQQTFAVKDHGFSVFNLSELHKGGYGGDITYKIKENISLKGFINNEIFRDFGINNDSYQLFTGLAFSMTF